MLTPRMQGFAIVTVLIFMVGMVMLLRKKRLSLKYSLLWLFSGVVMLILALFPGLLDTFSQMIGVYSSVNALFAVLLFCGMILMISFTAIVSRAKQEIVRLVQQVSLLENRIRELEAKPGCSGTGEEGEA